MEKFNIFPVNVIRQPKKGQILIAEPFLNDPNFSRSVILLCEHSEEGSVGFVLNHSTELTLDDLAKDLNASNINVYQGGPVQADTLHMLHRMPGRINGGLEIAKGVYWGGSYDELKKQVWEGKCPPDDIKLFMGYSGWGPGQLEKEIEEGTWLITDITDSLLFDTSAHDLWGKAIETMGPKYAYIAHMPTDPQLN